MAAFWRSSQPPKATAAKTLKHFDESDDPSSFHFLALRGNQYKHIVKGLISYYTQLKGVYTQQADQYAAKVPESLPIPFHETAFLPMDNAAGYQGALAVVRDKSRVLGEIYRELAESVDTQVITVLDSARQDIKALLKRMDEELGDLTSKVDKCRQDTAAALRDHDAGLALYEAPSHAGFSPANAHQDPFLTQSLASLRLRKQVELENRQTRIAIQYQSLFQDLEDKLNGTIVQASRSFLDIQLMGDVRLKAEFAAIETAISNVSTQAEWEHFAQPPRTLDPQTQPRSAEASSFPTQDHAAGQPLFSGPLDRQKSLTRSFASYHFVLSPAGYLHQFEAAGLSDVNEPEKLEPHLSIFLSDFTLSQPSGPDDPKGQRFSLTGARGSATGRDAQQGLGGSFGLGKTTLVTYVFKSDERNRLLDWWDALKRFCKLSAVEDGVKSPGAMLAASPSTQAVPMSPNPEENPLPPTPSAAAADPGQASPSTMAENDNRSSYMSHAEHDSTAATSIQAEDAVAAASPKGADRSSSVIGTHEDDGLQLREVDAEDDSKGSEGASLADDTHKVLKIEHSDSEDDGDLGRPSKVQDSPQLDAKDTSRDDDDEEEEDADDKEKEKGSETPVAH